MTRGEVNMKLMLRGLAKIPDTSKIVMGHLIPEYDMIMSNWQKVSQVAETIVPTWEELYLNEWVDVEEMIREESFMVSFFPKKDSPKFDIFILIQILIMNLIWFQ